VWVLEWRIEGDAVAALVGKIRALKLERPRLIEPADADARVQGAKAR
jgi:hypothetical protein